MRKTLQPDLQVYNHASGNVNYDVAFSKKMSMPAHSVLFYPATGQNSGTEFLRASK
jgi:hypothetical protein